MKNIRGWTGHDNTVDLAACVFRGDMRHPGSAYKKKNWRLHLYYCVDRGSRMTTCVVPRRGTRRKGGRHIEVVRANETDSYHDVPSKVLLKCELKVESITFLHNKTIGESIS